MTTAQKAADLLWEALESKQAIPPLTDTFSDLNIEKAYEAQEINTKRILENDQIVGKKIGLTSFSVQKQLGVDQPDYGMLFQSKRIENNTLSYSELMQPKAEAEIVFMLKNDLDGEIDMGQLIDAIDYAQIGIEVVGSRVADWKIKIEDTIADNASASHFVLGNATAKLADLDLVNCKMEMTKNQVVASEGTGKACMDNPLNAALWLAQKMSKQGSPLLAGELLFSGAVGPMVVIEPHDEFEASIEGLGNVSLKITE